MYKCPRCESILIETETDSGIYYCEGDCELNYTFQPFLNSTANEEYMYERGDHTFGVEIYRNNFHVYIDMDDVTGHIKSMIEINELRLQNTSTEYCEKVFTKLDRFAKLKAFW